MAGAIAAKLLAGQLGLSVGTIVYPWTAMRQVVEQCPHRTGTLLWIGSWVLPLMAVAWRELDSTILALILIVGALSYLSLWVAARILSRIIEEGYPRTTLYAVLGFASIPHLVVTVPIALYSDYMNVAVYTGLPAGIGLAVTGLSLLFGDDLLAAWWW